MPSVFSHIVCGTDGSEHGDRALDYAARLALAEGASLHVVHVIEKLVGPRVTGQDAHVDEREAQAKIREQVADLSKDPGLFVSLYIMPGTAQTVAQKLNEAAIEHEADVMVVGTRGHSAVAGVVLGSVTQRLLHLAHRPVLAVPPASVVTPAAS